MASGFDQNKFIQDLKKHEGVVLKIYPDPIHGASAPTCGVGHLLKPGDPHYGKPIGTVITEQEMLTYLENDADTAVANAVRLYPDFSSLPSEAQQVIANMVFNLGYSGLSKFKKMKAAVDRKDWPGAAAEMKNSLWYRQVKARGEELVSRMKNIK
eukprot:GFUD01011539.1.p1 GENE.GFUD01011539.1~~GFUD01011539.1.p1  ORF type:complete len:181 (+),score=51.26 GFUD01011539.1:81-545(+)